MKRFSEQSQEEKREDVLRMIEICELLTNTPFPNHIPHGREVFEHTLKEFSENADEILSLVGKLGLGNRADGLFEQCPALLDYLWGNAFGGEGAGNDTKTTATN